MELSSILDFCGYARRILGVENVTFNLTPVALKLGLSKETLNQVVACWQSEAKQLEMILLHWRENQENTDDYAMLRKALEGLEPEGKNAFRADYLVSFEKPSQKLKLRVSSGVLNTLKQ